MSLDTCDESSEHHYKYIVISSRESFVNGMINLSWSRSINSVGVKNWECIKKKKFFKIFARLY